MTIYRDGQAIELTNAECREIYDKLNSEYRKEDFRSRLEDMEIEFDDSDLDTLVERFDYALGKDDSYWDSYWHTIEYIIKNYTKEWN